MTFGPRFWAAPIDALVLTPVSLLGIILIFVKMPEIVFVPTKILKELSPYLYYVLMHAKFGQTIGKKVCNVKNVKVVVNKTEGRISLKQAFLRDMIPILITVATALFEGIMILSGKLDMPGFSDSKNMLKFGSVSLWIFVAAPSSWFIAEMVTMLTNKKRRALHDFVAGTVVVRTNVVDESLINKSEEDVAIEDVPDDLSESSKCVLCGATIPEDIDRCPSCGWTYAELIKE